MIQEVKERGPDLQIYPLRDRRILKDRKIELHKAGGAKTVTSHVAKVAGASKAVAVATAAKARRVAERARPLEGGKVRAGSPTAITDRANHIRTVKAFSRSRIVALKVVIELERLTILQVQGTITPPSIFQSRPASSHLGKFVAKVPAEAAPNVEV